MKWYNKYDKINMLITIVYKSITNNVDKSC